MATGATRRKSYVSGSEVDDDFAGSFITAADRGNLRVAWSGNRRLFARRLFGVDRVGIYRRAHRNVAGAPVGIAGTDPGGNWRDPFSDHLVDCRLDAFRGRDHTNNSESGVNHDVRRLMAEL